MSGTVLVGRDGSAWWVEGGPFRTGGQALLYRASAEDDGHPVVVKVAREPFDADVAAEAELLTRLGAHPTLGPFVVPAWDRGVWDDRPFVVLARMEGTLEDAVGRPLAERLALLGRVVRAVRTLHAAGLVHGDLKPANVLLDGDGAPFLADFGVARAGGLTRGYVPPGTTEASPPDEARDRWALAGTAWVVLVGAPPAGDASRDRATFDAAVPGRRALRDALLALRHPRAWRRPRDLATLEAGLRGERRPVDRRGIAALLALAASSAPVDAPPPCPDGYTLSGAVCQSAAGVRLVRVPAGRFRMGSSAPEDAAATADAPSHDVVVSRGFWMMEAEITQGEWASVVGEDPVGTRTITWGDRGEGPCSAWLGDSLVGSDRPVVCVSWREVVDYANALSLRDGLRPAYLVAGDDVSWDRSAPGWRLPTEAEWERAARGGDARPWAGAAGRDASCSHANIRDASARDRYPQDVPCDDGAPALAPVRGYLPNGLGLHDMYGNAREWVWDIYGPYEGDAVDPSGPRWGLDRVMRGHGWYDGGSGGVARRTLGPPDTRTGTVGARLVRTFP